MYVVFINNVNYYFVFFLVFLSYSYLLEGSILRLLFDFFDKVGKIGLWVERVMIFSYCFLL